MIDPIVIACLQPLPKSSSKTGSGKHGAENGPYHSPAPNRNHGRGKGKGKGKGKAKGGKSGSTLPEELKGLKTHTNQGVPICFACNSAEGCTYAKWSQRCGRGLHVCMRCGGHHAATSVDCKTRS